MKASIVDFLRSVTILILSVVCIALFIIMGGYAFYKFEHDPYSKEMQRRAQISNESIENLLATMWRLAREERDVDLATFKAASTPAYNRYVEALFNATATTKSGKAFSEDGRPVNVWTLNNAIFFATRRAHS